MKRIIAYLLAGIIFVPGAYAATGREALTVPDDSLTFEWEFLTSAYYSPLADQDFYLQGNFEAEKKLNGNGTNGADGTPVFYGMIAAPSTLPFGSKIYIPGIGLGEIHDRGGAIQNSRIDIWMGHGEAGLQRALEWGKRDKHCTVYLPGATIPEGIANKKFEDSFLFQDVQLASSIIDRLKSNGEDESFRALDKGDRNADVQTLQRKLQALGYLEEFPPTIYYGNQTTAAVLQFQLDNNIIESIDSAGAGRYGPQTAAKMEELITNLGSDTSVTTSTDSSSYRTSYSQSTTESQISVTENDIELASTQTEVETATGTGGPILDFTESLTLGSNGPEVNELQEVLKKLGYFQGQTTQYYGLQTAEAVYQFQLINGIVGNKETIGAGILGPRTRIAIQETSPNNSLSLETERTSVQVLLSEAFAGRPTS